MHRVRMLHFKKIICTCLFTPLFREINLYGQIQLLDKSFRDIRKIICLSFYIYFYIKYKKIDDALNVIQ